MPTEYRQSVLQAAHDDIKGGCHLGRRKTSQKITGVGLTLHKLSSVVKDYCGSCAVCQRSAPRCTADRAPLVKVPLIGELGDEIVIDVLGPKLNRTIRRNCFALVVVDTATRFVEICRELRFWEREPNLKS